MTLFRIGRLHRVHTESTRIPWAGRHFRTWEKIPVPFKFGGNEDGRYIGERLAVDPNLGSRLLLGTRHNGLWKSEDFGGTWQQVSAFPVTGSAHGAGIGFVIFEGSSGIAGRPSPTIYIGVATTQTNLYRRSQRNII